MALFTSRRSHVIPGSSDPMLIAIFEDSGLA